MEICITFGIGVAQIELGAAIDADGGISIAIPIAYHGFVILDPVDGDYVGISCGVGILEIQCAIFGSESTGGVLAIGIPIACNSHISYYAKFESCIGGSSGIGIAQQKGDFRTAIDTDGVDAVAIPVPGDG